MVQGAPANEQTAMRLINLLAIIPIALLSVVLWFLADRSSPVPEWPERVKGVAFAPYRQGVDPTKGGEPSLADIRSDAELLAGVDHEVGVLQQELFSPPEGDVAQTNHIGAREKRKARIVARSRGTGALPAIMRRSFSCWPSARSFPFSIGSIPAWTAG